MQSRSCGFERQEEHEPRGLLVTHVRRAVVRKLLTPASLRFAFIVNRFESRRLAKPAPNLPFESAIMTYNKSFTELDEPCRNAGPGGGRVAVVYCTSTGTTRLVAGEVVRALPELTDGPFDLEQMTPEALLSYRALILGVPSVEAGRLPDAWRRALEQLNGGTFRGKLVAIFGVGDAESYPASFVDSMGQLQRQLAMRGARFVGGWPTDGYRMLRSEAVVDGRFVGLALDRAATPSANHARIRAWASQVRLAFEDHLDTRGAAGLVGFSGVAA